LAVLNFGVCGCRPTLRAFFPTFLTHDIPVLGNSTWKRKLKHWWKILEHIKRYVPSGRKGAMKSATPCRCRVKVLAAPGSTGSRDLTKLSSHSIIWRMCTSSKTLSTDISSISIGCEETFLNVMLHSQLETINWISLHNKPTLLSYLTSTYHNFNTVPFPSVKGSCCMSYD